MLDMDVTEKEPREDHTITLHALKDSMGEDADEFIAVMNIVQDIIDNPDKYHGKIALRTAATLAAYRTKISLKAQYYKTVGANTVTRRRKDVLQSMYHSLEENIQTLKLLGRIDASVSGIMR